MTLYAIYETVYGLTVKEVETVKEAIDKQDETNFLKDVVSKTKLPETLKRLERAYYE